MGKTVTTYLIDGDPKGTQYALQHGEVRADYGKGLQKELAAPLSKDFGKGFDESNLRYMRLFYRCFPIWDTLRPELAWLLV